MKTRFEKFLYIALDMFIFVIVINVLYSIPYIGGEQNWSPLKFWASVFMLIAVTFFRLDYKIHAKIMNYINKKIKEKHSQD